MNEAQLMVRYSNSSGNSIGLMGPLGFLLNCSLLIGVHWRSAPVLSGSIVNLLRYSTYFVHFSRSRFLHTTFYTCNEVKNFLEICTFYFVTLLANMHFVISIAFPAHPKQKYASQKSVLGWNLALGCRFHPVDAICRPLWVNSFKIAPPPE